MNSPDAKWLSRLGLDFIRKKIHTDQRYFLYLTKREWADSWINGGVVPLSMTTKYISAERDGIYTPDEDFHRRTIGAPDWAVDRAFNIEGGTFHFQGDITINGDSFKNVKHSQFAEPALVLCLSTECSATLAARFKKEVCIEILDLQSLKDNLDKQVGIVGEPNYCEYTETKNRGHFMKSVDDAWQKEYRIIWPRVTEERQVSITRGFCKLMEL